MKIISLLFFLTWNSSPSPEQAAFDYFAQNISSQYSNSKLYFSGLTEEYNEWRVFNGCFSNDAEFEKVKLKSRQEFKSRIINHSGYDFIKVKKKRSRNGLNLVLYNAFKTENNSFVVLEIYESEKFRNFYLLKYSNESNSINEICERGEYY